MLENVIFTSSASWQQQPNIVRAIMSVEQLTPCRSFGLTSQASTRIHYPAAVHVLNDVTVQKILSRDSDALAENTMRYLEQAFLFGESDF